MENKRYTIEQTKYSRPKYFIWDNKEQRAMADGRSLILLKIECAKLNYPL